MAPRVRQVMGALATNQQIQQETTLVGSLLAEGWTLINEKGEPYGGKSLKRPSLVFTKRDDRFRFSLELPDVDHPRDAILFIGETSPHVTPENPVLQGKMISPPECSESRLTFDGVENDPKLGRVLRATLFDACRVGLHASGGPVMEFLDFQTVSELENRLAQEEKTAALKPKTRTKSVKGAPCIPKSQ
jgi:hypothetical protein